MVMKKIKIKHLVPVISLCCTVVTGTVYADGFYTIIGPDGRPMVVPKKDEKKTETLKKEVDTSVQPVIQEEQRVPVKNIIQTEQQPTHPSIAAPRIESKALNSQVHISLPDVQPIQSQQNDKTISIPVPSTVKVEPKNPEPIHQIVDKEKRASVVLPQQVSSPVVGSTNTNTNTNTNNTLQIEPAEFNQIDGVEYVNNEYLEEQEFNLDGKKRFYTMPDGTGRMETIERKKGVGRSILDKIMKRPQQSTPITLSDHYVRLSAQDLSVTFENERCFVENYPKSKSIKTLTPQKEVGLWPRQPLKEKFEYELVKLDPSIQYMQFDSYASSNEKPVYYWPLVIFLDQKGCIQEGASGFKNSVTKATVLQHSSIQGVLKVPPQTYYMMLTPLASAVDVPEQALSNQGQIKISVLQ